MKFLINKILRFKLFKKNNVSKSSITTPFSWS